jgi:hypothetical protein
MPLLPQGIDQDQMPAHKPQAIKADGDAHLTGY